MTDHIEHVNPRDDVEFVALVDQLSGAAKTPSELERALRATYGQVVVRPRALTGERLQVWYVYRDGSWTPSGGGDLGEP